MSEQVAPGTEAATGQGEGQSTETPADYAGFKTPEELVSAYQSSVSEQEALKTQISNLESLKGRHGNEIGQLRQQLANLTGQIEGMRAVQPQEQGPSLDDIAKQLENGDIEEAEALRLASKVTEQQVSTKLGAQFKQELKAEIDKLKRDDYIKQFMADNKGYKEAYESGKLQQWLDQGLSGEEAWDKYQLQTTKAELDALKNQSEEARKAAEAAGVDKGIQIEQSKSAAGKVLDGKGGRFSQVTSKFNLSNPNERRSAGVELLHKMRGG